MREQCEILNGLGLTAVCLGMDRKDTANILAGKFQFLFTSPETILGNEEFREMLRSDVYKGHIGLIVIDEAHTVVQWGEAASNEEPFREWFAKLGELRCLIPSTPVLALTATASKKRRRTIQKLLAMQGCKELIDNPDRPNIKLHVLQVESSQPLEKTFEWLLNLARSHTEDSQCPRVLLFTKSIDDCARIYVLCRRYLDKDHMKIIEMYHSQTPESTKCRIRDDMSKPDGSVRVLVCTTAAGMGVNFAAVENVVNYGPPQEMDTLLQQQGRAGRGGAQAHHVLIYNNRQLRNLDPEMLRYVRNAEGTCRREILLSHYSASCDDSRILHTCCDVCSVDCKCDSVDCSQLKPVTYTAEDSDDSDSDLEPQTECNITTEQKEALKLSLNQYRLQLNEDSKSSSVTTAAEATHGFTETVIDSVVRKCTILQSADDVLALCNVWSYEQAQTVYVIVRSVLDTESDDANSDIDYTGQDD